MNVAQTEVDLVNFLNQAMGLGSDMPVVISKFIVGATVVGRQSGPHLGFFSWKKLSKTNVTKSDQTLQ